jgi:hypothetical protein
MKLPMKPNDESFIFHTEVHWQSRHTQLHMFIDNDPHLVDLLLHVDHLDLGHLLDGLTLVVLVKLCLQKQQQQQQL